MAREEVLLRSVSETTWRFYLWVGALCGVVAWGASAYLRQLHSGLIVTGMRDQVSWGLYITNFVFFIGISHVGALLSAILRFSGAEWRRPLTRMAEAITFASLFIGGLMPVIDMGRPDRLLNLFRFPRIQSTVLWDIISVGTYLTGSTLFLWVLLLPDIALLRDNLLGVGLVAQETVSGPGDGLPGHHRTVAPPGTRDCRRDDSDSSPGDLRSHSRLVDLRDDLAARLGQHHLRPLL